MIGPWRYRQHSLKTGSIATPAMKVNLVKLNVWTLGQVLFSFTGNLILQGWHNKIIKNTNWMKLFGTFCELVQVKYQVHLEPIKFISNKIYDFINILLGPVSIEWRCVNCYLWNYYQIHSDKMDFFLSNYV